MVLLAGGVAAQLLPLLLGPWLSRLYTPAEFGSYFLLAAVAANMAVVACARYEFALPMAGDDAEALHIAALCRWLLLGVTGLAAVAGVAWALVAEQAWPLWLPLLAATLGWISLGTLASQRAQRFDVLALARLAQHGGAALLQLGAGLLGAGLHGLVVGAQLAALAAGAMLRLPAPGWWRLARSKLQAVALRHKDFPLLNGPHAFLGALQDSLALALIALWLGPVEAGLWGLALRYLKAPATLVGSAVSQALYPLLARERGVTPQARRSVRQLMLVLSVCALPLVLGLWWGAPRAFELAFGQAWRGAGEMASALAVYIGLHFIASPLSVVPMAWRAQAWALRLALKGQALFLAALAGGLLWGGLVAAAWAVSLAMSFYFAWFFWRLARWPLDKLADSAAGGKEGE